MSFTQKITGIMSGTDDTWQAGLVRLGLNCLVPPYLLVTHLRNKCFDVGCRQAVNLGRFTISVGNVSAGGTGKTPVVADLYQRLQARGHTPAILMRGYRSEQTEACADGGGDEARVYRKTLGETVPLGINPKRVIGASEVLAMLPNVDVFLLDDAFQHRQAARDINIVLVDAESWLHDHVLPRGFLRESKSSVKRADLLILTHVNRLPMHQLEAVRYDIARFSHAPQLECIHTWSHMLDENGERHELDQFKAQNMTWLAVCGIGKPAVFLNMVKSLTNESIHKVVYQDHTAYDNQLVREHLRKAIDANAGIIMTEKDWVKWGAHYAEMKLSEEEKAITVLRPQLSIVWLGESESLLETILVDVMKKIVG